MYIAILSTYPPDVCGIAEYTYDLTKNILEISPKTKITIYRLLTRDISNLNYELPNVNIVDTGEVIGNVNFKKIINLMNDRFDVLHIQHEYALYPNNEAFIEFIKEVKSRKVCDKLVVTLHNVRHTYWYPNIDTFQRKLVNLVDVVIVHSTLQEMELLHQGVDIDKVVKIPHGTRLANIYSKSYALSKLGLEFENNTKIVLIQGFLRRDKGLHIILEAFRKVNSVRDDVVLVIAGKVQDIGTNNTQYVNTVFQRFGDIKNVLLLSKYFSRHEVDLLYSIADLIVFPYVDVTGDIGVSGAFHWALGSFKPIVCTRVPRLIECYECAPQLTVPPLNILALSKKIVSILNNEIDVKTPIEKLKSYAIETCWLNVAKMHLKVYNGEDMYIVDKYELLTPIREDLISGKVKVSV